MVIDTIALYYALYSAWTLLFLGLALWKSAKRGHAYWFIACLVFHWYGILPIIYLLLTTIRERKGSSATVPVVRVAEATTKTVAKKAQRKKATKKKISKKR